MQRRMWFLVVPAVLAIGAATVPTHARTSSPSTPYQAASPRDLFCPPLGPAEGTVVRVSSVAELQSAVRNLASNTTILVADGEYRLENTLHLFGGLRNVAIRGESGDRDAVVLRGRGMSNTGHGNVPHGVLVGDATDVLIADLSIRDVYYHAVQIQGEQGAVRTKIYNVHIADVGEQLVKGSSGGPPGPYADDGEVACSLLEYTDRARDDYTNGVDVLAGANWVVRDNVFKRIRAPVGQLAGPAVLFWRNSIGTIVERNLFIECDRPIALGLSSPDTGRARDGEQVYDHQGGIIRNNMIYQPAGAATGDIGITVNYARDFKILHNTVILNGTFPMGAIEYRFAVSDGEISNNLTDAPIWRRNGAQAELSRNVTAAEPSWFVDAAAADLHLRPDAGGAIDFGQTHADVTHDYDGEVRPSGVRADVGADELHVPGTEPAATRRPSETPTGQGTEAPTATESTTRVPSATITNSPTASPTADMPPPTRETATGTPTTSPTARLFLPWSYQASVRD